MLHKVKFVLALPTVAMAGMLTGCASEPTCDYSNETYMSAQSVPSVRAPDGLTAPDTSASLTIPAVGPNAKPVPTGKGRCLDRPPPYFGSSPAKADAKSEPPKK